MIVFIALAAVLIGAALWFVLWPLRSRGAAASAALREHDNVRIYQQRQAELRAEHEEGRLDAHDLELLSDELAASLLDDVPETAEENSAPIVPDGGRWAPLLLAGLVPCAAVLLYLTLGAGSEFELAEAADLLRSPVDRPVALAELVARLERRVGERPEDADSYFLLGHARMRERNFGAAAASFSRVLALRGPDPNTEVSLVQAQFLADGGRLSEATRGRVDALLEQIPNQPLVLEMLAVDAVAAGNHAAAVGYLQQALAGGVSNARASALRAELERIRQMAGLASGPAIDVVVRGLSDLSGLPPEAVVYIIARAEGVRLPRMVARTDIGRDPVRLRLDQSTVMGEQPPLREGEQLQVVARVSPDGDVVAGPDTREVSSLPVILGAEPVRVQLDLGATEGAAIERPAEVPGPVNGEPEPAADSVAAITVSISAHPGLEAPPDTRVYVIVRPTHGPPMPIAVRALSFADLPAVVLLTDGDAMAPGRVLSGFDEVAVLARLALGGSPMKQPGDVESDVRALVPRERPEVSLELR